MQTNVNAKDFLHAFHGLDFPASRSQIVGAAKDTGGLNGDVLLFLEQIPERMYATAKDLTDEIQHTPLATSTGGNTQSASASAISDATKELISTMADPRRGDIEPGEPTQSPASATPGGDGAAQAERILARNSKLLNDTVEPSAEGEAETGVGHTVNSDRSHAGGDYSND